MQLNPARNFSLCVFFVFIYVTCIFILYVRTVGYRQSTSEGWQTKYYRGSMASIEFVTFRTGKYSIWNITGETQMTSVNFRIDQSFLSAASPAEPIGDGNFSLLFVLCCICVTWIIYTMCVYRLSTSEGWRTKYYRGSMASIEFVTFRTGKYSIWNIAGETQTTSVNFRTDQSFLNTASPVEPTGEGNFSLLCVFVFYLCNMNIYTMCTCLVYRLSIGEGWQMKYYRGSVALIEFVTFRTGKYSEWNITGETQTTSVNFRTDQSFLSTAVEWNRASNTRAWEKT